MIRSETLLASDTKKRNRSSCARSRALKSSLACWRATTTFFRSICRAPIWCATTQASILCTSRRRRALLPSCKQLAPPAQTTRLCRTLARVSRHRRLRRSAITIRRCRCATCSSWRLAKKNTPKAPSVGKARKVSPTMRTKKASRRERRQTALRLSNSTKQI